MIVHRESLLSLCSCYGLEERHRLHEVCMSIIPLYDAIDQALLSHRAVNAFKRQCHEGKMSLGRLRKLEMAMRGGHAVDYGLTEGRQNS